jgi:hypothetical protein
MRIGIGGLLIAKQDNTGLRLSLSVSEALLTPDGPLASCLTWLQAGRPNHHDARKMSQAAVWVNAIV